MVIKLSAIIACRNEERDIGNCIEAILSQTLKRGNFEAIFIDGGSTDKTIGIILKYARRNKNIRLIKERGPCKSAANARNQGARVARGGILLFFDADAVPEEGYFEEIIRMPENMQAASSHVKPFPSRSFWAILRECETQASNYLVEKGGGIQFPNIFRKKYFLGLGGYEAKYVYGEDLRLLERMKNKGDAPKTLKKAVIMHRDPDTLDEIAAQSRFWGKGFYKLFFSDPKRHFPRLAMVIARALWLPLYLAYLAMPFNLLLLTVALLFLTSLIDAMIITYRSTKMGAALGYAIFLMPFRMIRSFFFLQGFMMAMLDANKR